MSLFRHLLLPTDGSASSEAAIRQALQFGRERHAHVTAVHVVPEFHVLTYRTTMLEGTRAEFLAECQAEARKILTEVERAAQEIGVGCSTRVLTNDHPYEAILSAASEFGCDLIVMASHGHRGLKGLLMGSETHKLLTHTTVPVLVLH